MAFMMPVVKNDWDIYKSNRSRKTSECNTSCTPRSRKLSEWRQDNGVANNVPTLPKHHSMPDRMSSRGLSRTRTGSDNLPSPATGKIHVAVAVAVPPSTPSDSLKRSGSWLDKIRKFIKNAKAEEDERSQS